jgi:hypothetical protein
LGSEAGDDAVGSAGDEGVVPEGFAVVDVGDMDFDDRGVEGAQRVEDGYGGVGEGGGVDDDAGCDVAGFVDPGLL